MKKAWWFGVVLGAAIFTLSLLLDPAERAHIASLEWFTLQLGYLVGRAISALFVGVLIAFFGWAVWSILWGVVTGADRVLSKLRAPRS